MSLPPANDKGNAQKAALVEQSAAGIKNKRNHLGPEWFDADVLANVVPYNQSSVDIPNNAFLVGQYLPRDQDLDRRLTQWFSIPSASGGANTEWGIKTQPTEMLIDYAEQKNKMAQYRSELDLAAQLIDPKDPSSQRVAFGIYPELRDIPEERSIKIAKFHVMLEAILRAGTCNSREEVQMIFVLLDPRTVIPMKPGWTEMFGLDSTGVASNSAPIPNVFKNTLYWFFDPYAYQSKNTTDGWANTSGGMTDQEMMLLCEAPLSDAEKLQQAKIKIAIARRLFPALREANQANVVKFIYNLAVRDASAAGSGKGSNILKGPAELLPIIGGDAVTKKMANLNTQAKFGMDLFK